jgi:hypothetical protein
MSTLSGRNDAMSTQQEIRQKYSLLKLHLKGRLRRLWAGAESGTGFRVESALGTSFIYQSEPSTCPTSGGSLQAMRQVLRLMLPDTERTLASPRPTCIAPVCAV